MRVLVLLTDGAYPVRDARLAGRDLGHLLRDAWVGVLPGHVLPDRRPALTAAGARERLRTCLMPDRVAMYAQLLAEANALLKECAQ